jgi:hypothetical protein
MTRRLPHTAPAIQSLETRRLLAYIASSSSFEFVDLVPGEQNVTTLLNNTDDGFGTINLDTLVVPGGSNTFRYFGTEYHAIHVSANGLITLVNGSTDPENGDLTSSPPQRTLAVLWDDWDTNGGSGATDSSVLYRYDAQREELTIEWNNVPHVNVGGSNGVTFQAILDLNESAPENDEMKFQYADLVVGNPTYDNGNSATVGIKNVGVATGLNRVLVFQNGGGPQQSLVGVGKCLEIEDVPVQPLAISSSDFGYETLPHTFSIAFNGPVLGLDPADLSVVPQAGGPAITPTSVTGEGSTVATFTFASPFADGRYTATLAAGSVTNAAGTPLAADYQANFLFLTGDANNDGAVNLSDFNVLASNFGQSPRNFAQGDFNYDGTVNLQDFNLLAARFGTSVAPAATAPSAGTTSVTNLLTQPSRGSALTISARGAFADRPISKSLSETDDRPDLLLA